MHDGCLDLSSPSLELNAAVDGMLAFNSATKIANAGTMKGTAL